MQVVLLSSPCHDFPYCRKSDISFQQPIVQVIHDRDRSDKFSSFGCQYGRQNLVQNNYHYRVKLHKQSIILGSNLILTLTAFGPQSYSCKSCKKPFAHNRHFTCRINGILYVFRTAHVSKTFRTIWKLTNHLRKRYLTKFDFNMSVIAIGTRSSVLSTLLGYDGYYWILMQNEWRK